MKISRDLSTRLARVKLERLVVARARDWQRRTGARRSESLHLEAISEIGRRNSRKSIVRLAKHDDRRFGVKAGDSSPSFQVALLALQVHSEFVFGVLKQLRGIFKISTMSFPRVWSRGRCRQRDMKRQRWVEGVIKALPAGKARRVSRIRKARISRTACWFRNRESEIEDSGPTSHSVRRS